MDQLRAFWTVLRRQHFWVLSVLVCLLAMVGWMLAIASLKSEQQKYASDIESRRQTASQVQRVERHANPDTQKWMDDLLKKRKEEVLQAWKERDKQLVDLLQWPKRFDDNFVSVVSKLRPVESKVPFPLGTTPEPLRIDQRQIYRDFIREELPELAKRIGAQWLPSATTGGGRSEFGMPSGFADSGGRLSHAIVDWSPTNQAEIQQEHFTWGSQSRSGGPIGFDAPTTGSNSERDNVPTTLEVMYAQEDLWVLTALVNIVQSTNAGATVQHTAGIKRIDFLRMGKLAGMSAGKVTRVQAAAAGGAAVGGPGLVAMGDVGGAGLPSGGPGGFGMEGAEAAVAIDPAENRYVDKFYKPLSAAALRAAMASTDPQNAYLAVAKRMPIRMRFFMDQRKINDLLVQCANSDLTVEVRQVRISRPAAEITQSLGGAGLEGPRGEGPAAAGPTGLENEDMLGDILGVVEGAAAGGPLSEFGGRRREGEFGNFGGSPQATSNENPFPFDVWVEVFGIIYVFNPVDQTKLDGGADAASGPIAQR